jgi:hypothetical protein
MDAIEKDNPTLQDVLPIADLLTQHTHCHHIGRS